MKIKNRVHSHVKVFSAHVSGSPFAPNEVPAPVCAAALAGKPVSRSDGL